MVKHKKDRRKYIDICSFIQSKYGKISLMRLTTQGKGKGIERRGMEWLRRDDAE